MNTHEPHQSKKFNIGDIVILKSGGQFKMTVNGYSLHFDSNLKRVTDVTKVNCVWEDKDGKHQTQIYDEDILELAV